MLRRLMILGLIATLVPLTLAFVHVRVVREGAGGDLLSAQDEALLFISVNRFGYRMNYLTYTLELFREALGAVRPPDDRGCSTVAIRITGATAYKYEDNERCFNFYTPIDNVIYANDEGHLSKWVNTRFERMSPEEQAKMKGIGALAGNGVAHVAGWEIHRSIMDNPDAIKIVLEDRLGIIEVNRDQNSQVVSVKLEHSSGSVEKIWDLSEEPRRISRSEYSRLFAKR